MNLYMWNPCYCFVIWQQVAYASLGGDKADGVLTPLQCSFSQKSIISKHVYSGGFFTVVDYVLIEPKVIFPFFILLKALVLLL